MHHMGVDRTLFFLARKVIPNINRDEIREIVRTCNRCQSIDPVHDSGMIHFSKNWEGLTIVVTHYRNEVYLSMVDFVVQGDLLYGSGLREKQRR